jgi:hypothetical protein
LLIDIVINAELDAAPAGSEPLPHQANFYHNILACLGYSNESPPVADLLRSYHGLEGEWLVVSPIHWQATHNDAMIVASGHDLGLSDSASRLWFAALAEFVALDNIKLHYHDAATWLLQAEGKPQLTAKPVHTLHHQSMMPELKRLDDTLFWQRFITENQMFFSAHALNKTRTELYPINGLWLWGGGQLHKRVKNPLICSDDGLVRLANLLSTHVSAYGHGPSVAQNSVLLLNELSLDEQFALQTQLQKNTVRWYWNNVAYLSKPKSWLSRLIERVQSCL